MKNTVITGDCLEILAMLSDKYEVIIADPPYNIGKDFGNDSDSQPLSEYLEWSKQWISLCLTRLSEDGLLFVYGFSEILARISSQYPLSNQKWLIWHYTNKNVPQSRWWQRSHESILVLWNGKRPDLYIDQIRIPYQQEYSVAGKVRSPNSPSGRLGHKSSVYTYHPAGALPRDVIEVPALAGGSGAKERWFLCLDCKEIHPPILWKSHKGHELMKHPTQKPMELTRQLLLSRLEPGNGKVLIPFCWFRFRMCSSAKPWFGFSRH